MKHFIKHAHSSMSRYSFPLILFFLFLSFAACQDDDERAIKNPGILSLALAADTTFGNSAVATKASVADEFIGFTNPNEYAVEILQGEEVVLSYARFGDMPDEIELAPGSYTMRAYRGNNYPGRFSNPYFEGKTDFKIEKGMRTPIRDTATLANTRVFVNYTDDFIDAYEEFRVRMNTEYMQTDTLNFREDETRAGYFRSDAEGTELILSLWLVKREDTIINYYKPEPLTIFPRENIRLLFKTDGEALNGIGLEVTVNNELDGEKTLNMTIPEYAWGDVKEPTLYPNYFEDITEPQPTYFALQNGNYVRYLDYVIPGSVGKCIVSISKSVNGGTAITTEYDLTNATDAAAARALGITLGDRNNDKTYTVATEAKEGRIHFTEALAKLPASTDEVEYIYSVYILDALPTNPNSTETVQMVVAPKGVGPSTLVGTGVSDYTILATEVLPNDIVINYDTDAGIQSSKLIVKRGETVISSYDILADVLPDGISYLAGKLKFDAGFVKYLEVEPLTDVRYTFIIDAVDNLERDFVNTPMSFSIKLNYVFEIVVPGENIWGWKAKVGSRLSGLSDFNKTNLSLYISSDGNIYEPLYNYTIEGVNAMVWKDGLTNGTTYFLRAEYNNVQVNSQFTTEDGVLEYGDMNLWYLGNTTCYYGYGSGSNRKPFYIPFVYLNNTSQNGGWETNNYKTAGESYSNVGSSIFSATQASSLPPACFPTVVYEDRNDINGLAAVIRSINVTAPNSSARGELRYSNSSWNSRPSSISFEYLYAADNNESFEVTIVVKGEDGTIIGSGSKPSAVGDTGNETTYQNCHIPINYTIENKVAGKIEILFASTDNANSFSTSLSGTLTAPNATATGGTVTSSNYSQANFSNVKYGSTLKIDNVILNYTGQ